MSLKSTHASSLNLTAFFFFDKDIKVNDYLDYDSIKQYIKQLEMRFFFLKKACLNLNFHWGISICISFRNVNLKLHF